MSNSWLRLWHDMPTDPKWRTLARISGESIPLVISVYTCLLVDASRNVTRGHVTVTDEDLASLLDVTEAQIAAVHAAMEGRVLDNGYLTGWEKRQPKREDQGSEESGAKSAAQRKKEQRDRERLEKEARENAKKSSDVTDGHDESRNVTLDKDKDKDKEESIKEPKGSLGRATRKCPDSFSVDEALLTWAAEKAPLADLAVETAKLRDHTFKNAISDWAGAWRNWIRKAQQDAASRTTRRPAQQGKHSAAAQTIFGKDQTGAIIDV